VTGMTLARQGLVMDPWAGSRIAYLTIPQLMKRWHDKT